MKQVFNAAAAILVASVCAVQPSAAQSARPAVIDPQNGLTLGQAIAEGLAAEPGIIAARLEIDAARGERRQTALTRGTPWLPSSGLSRRTPPPTRASDKLSTLCATL